MWKYHNCGLLVHRVINTWAVNTHPCANNLYVIKFNYDKIYIYIYIYISLVILFIYCIDDTVLKFPPGHSLSLIHHFTGALIITHSALIITHSSIS